MICVRMCNKHAVKLINSEVLYIIYNSLRRSDLTRIDKNRFSAASEQSAVALTDVNKADIHFIGARLLSVSQSALLKHLVNRYEILGQKERKNRNKKHSGDCNYF